MVKSRKEACKYLIWHFEKIGIVCKVIEIIKPFKKQYSGCYNMCYYNHHVCKYNVSFCFSCSGWTSLFWIYFWWPLEHCWGKYSIATQWASIAQGGSNSSYIASFHGSIFGLHSDLPEFLREPQFQGKPLLPLGELLLLFGDTSVLHTDPFLFKDKQQQMQDKLSLFVQRCSSTTAGQGYLEVE